RPSRAYPSPFSIEPVALRRAANWTRARARLRPRPPPRRALPPLLPSRPNQGDFGDTLRAEVQMTRARLFLLPVFLFALASGGVYACSATGGGSEFGQGGAGGTGNGNGGPGGGFAQSGDSSGDGLFDAGANGASAGSGGTGCSVEAQYVYVVDENRAFYKFDP